MTVGGASGQGSETVTITFTPYDLTAPWSVPAAGSADRCSSDGVRNTFTCTLVDGQTATFHVGAFNLRDSGWFDVSATQDGERAEPVRITVDRYRGP